MRFGVLGPLAVWTGAGEAVAIPGVKVRAVLADLIVHEGRPVSTDRLVEDLWGDDPPANPLGALQVRVSQLRKALGEGRDLVESRAPGYLLRADPDAVDAWRFATLAARAERVEDVRTRAGLLAEALGLWRGPAFAEFADEEFARAAVARLEEQRLAVVELHAEARLELGEHSVLAGELGDLVARHPLRERLRAVHMRALYRAGRQSEALDSYADLRDRLDEELGLEPGPDLVALHQAILEQDAALGPVRQARPPRGNLPAALTELIGREDAVTELRALLADARLVTLTGPGGVGKTRLALETAGGLAAADGVWLVELAALDRGDDLADHIMAVLDIRDTTADRLASALSGRQLLLVLDNCEHLVEPVADLVAALLPAAPGLRVIATSREPLDVGGEVVWEVPPLDVPDPADHEVERFGAVRLFAARAAASARGFVLDDDNRAAVARLCARLDGIPLAIELAATRVRTLGVHGLVDRLDDRFRLLTGPRGAPARQRTLAAVIDWSWDLLTEPERVVLRRLAVHSGGCTAEAAEAVCGEDPDVLARLVDRSLVVLADDPDGPRYRLLESVAAYGMDRLVEAGEVDEVRARHAAYYTELAVRADPLLRGPDQARWLRRLDAESANLHAALAGPDAPRLAGALVWYWVLRGRLSEARRALSVVSEKDSLARVWLAGIELRQGETADWARRRPGIIAIIDGLDDATQARARWFLASAEAGHGEIEDTERLLDAALSGFERTDDRWGTAAALTTRAMFAHIRGDMASLARDAERAADLFRALGDGWGVLQATEWLAGLADMTDDHERAIRLHREGLRLAEDLGLWPDVASRLCWLGWLALRIGDHDEARELAERAMRLAVEQDSAAVAVFAELVLAFSARRAGKLDLAESHLRTLLRTADTDPPAVHLPMVRSELGFIAESTGDADAALTHHTAAFDAAARLDAHRDLALALEGMAGASALAGNHVHAARLLGAAAAHRTKHDLPVGREEKAEAARIATAVRAELGEEGFTAEFDRGGEADPVSLRSTPA